MEVVTKQIPEGLRHLDFTSKGFDDLLGVLEMFFERDLNDVWWRVDEQGYHLATDESAYVFHEEGLWEHEEPSVPLPLLWFLTPQINTWLDEMPYPARLKMTEDQHVPPTDGPSPTLTGFRVLSSRSKDGRHYKVTVTPAWV